jgi:hypothetical protein
VCTYQNSTGTTGDNNFRWGLTSKSLTDLGKPTNLLFTSYSIVILER